MIADRFGERTEDDADSGQLLPEGRGNRNAVEHRVDRDTGELLALPQRNAELLVGLEQLRIDLVQALRPVRA